MGLALDAREKLDAALANCFRPGNLGALRELALLWVGRQLAAAHIPRLPPALGPSPEVSLINRQRSVGGDLEAGQGELLSQRRRVRQTVGVSGPVSTHRRTSCHRRGQCDRAVCSEVPQRTAALLAAGSLDPQGPVAEAMADLWWLMLTLGAAVFVVFAVVLAVGLSRRRTEAGPEPSRRTQEPTRWIVAGGVVMPLVVLLVVLGATVYTMRVVPTTAPREALVVEVVGHQWWWEVHYPDEGITTANELHIPVGRPIALQLTSADVIHSFWVPALGGKMDLLPDGTNTLVLQADEPGEHRSHCAEFCGLQHANHGLIVVAEPAERFASWVAAQQQPAVEPAGATAQRGLDVFLGSDCVRCHAIRGTTADVAGGPDLTHFASRPMLGAGVLPNTPGHLAAWVADPHAIKPGVEMPASELTEEDLDALLAYLGSLE